jgi:hypothetical protein
LVLLRSRNDGRLFRICPAEGESAEAPPWTLLAFLCESRVSSQTLSLRRIRLLAGC